MSRARKPCVAGAVRPFVDRGRCRSRRHSSPSGTTSSSAAGSRPAKRLLIHGGTSGIGTTAIQLAKAFGARVIATAGTPEKCEACRKLGAEVAINYKTEDFVEATKKATDGRGADLVLDIIGGDYIERNYEAAAVEGRILQIAFQSSPRATVDFRRLMLKRLTHTGSTLRARAVADKAAIARAIEAKVLAADCGRAGQAGDRLDLSAARGRGRACPHGQQPAYRQDRPDPLKRTEKSLRGTLPTG